jgi:hypothetical protein
MLVSRYSPPFYITAHQSPDPLNSVSLSKQLTTPRWMTSEKSYWKEDTWETFRSIILHCQSELSQVQLDYYLSELSHVQLDYYQMSVFPELIAN